MGDLLRGEWLKILTTRGSVLLVAGAVTMVALATASMMASMPARSLTGPVHEQMAYFIGSVVLSLFSAVIGVRSFTDEFRHGTMVPTILVSQSRRRLLVAKITVAVGVTLAMSVLGLAALVAVTLALAAVKGGDVAVAGSDWGAFAGFVGAMLSWTILGIGLGAVVRHQVAGIVGALVWVLVVENVASAIIGGSARYLPGQLGHGMARTGGAAELVGALPATGLLAAYALLASLGAAVTLERRDVV